MSDDGNIWAKPTEKRLKNKTNDFNFDFAEKYLPFLQSMKQ